jgi:outer membrane protein
MKKLIITAAIFFLALTAVHAQKIAYVDSQYILDNLPEYTEAQAQLDEVSIQWQKEIEAKFAEVDKMNQAYQAQAVLLPEDMKNLQRQRFGQNGDLMKKREELVKPIQEKIYNAIQEIATNNNYSIIFDKAGALTILFSNPKYDISDEVLDNLGTAAAGRKGRSTTGTQKGQQPNQGTSKGAQEGNQGSNPMPGNESTRPKK